MLNKILNAIKDTHLALLASLGHESLNSPAILILYIAISLA